MLQQIEEKLQYHFCNKVLLQHAFTHSSFGKQENVEFNERLEFLGDSVLGFIVSEFLFCNFPQRPEGDLTVIKSKVVSASTLSVVVDKLGVAQYLQASANFTVSPDVKADLFEAVLGAIFIDGGLESVKQFVFTVLNDELTQTDAAPQKDSKSVLKELCEKNKKLLEYRLIERSGPDNKPTYRYAIYIDGVFVCEGDGVRKNTAQQVAARKIVEDGEKISALFKKS